jgi:structure-specific recognition protein 1
MMNVALREAIAKLEQLEKHYEKSTFEVVSSVLRTLLKKTIISVDSFQRQVVVASQRLSQTDRLRSRIGHSGLKANLKANLFMLDKFIFFVSKQPVLIEISDIHQNVFSHVGAGIATARTSDMQIVTKHVHVDQQGRT